MLDPMPTNPPSPNPGASQKKRTRKQKKTGPGWQLTELTIAKLQVRTLISAPTIRRWARGFEVNEANTIRLNEAAAAMGLKRKSDR